MHIFFNLIFIKNPTQNQHLAKNAFLGFLNKVSVDTNELCHLNICGLARPESEHADTLTNTYTHSHHTTDPVDDFIASWSLPQPSHSSQENADFSSTLCISPVDEQQDALSTAGILCVNSLHPLTNVVSLFTSTEIAQLIRDNGRMG